MTDSVLDLFCGAGGLSLGFEWAGYDTILGIDSDEHSVRTFSENFNSPCLEEDLTEMHPSEAPVSKEEVDIIAGGPPCQDFSVANFYSRGGEKTNLVFVFSEWVSHYEPDVFVMENVSGIKTVGNVFYDLLDEFEESGYNTTYRVCNAHDYGVPQIRNRMIVVGSKSGSFMFPEPDGDSKTVADAFEGLPEIGAGEEDTGFYNHKAPDHREETIEMFDGVDYGECPYDSWNEKVRLDPNEPCPTMKSGKRSTYHFIHPEKNRGLTVRERARIQTFPDWFKFCGPVVSQRSQTGNAVPPLMGEGIVSDLKENIKKRSVFNY